MLNAKQGFASFSVDDLGRAKEFYAGMLGLEASVSEMDTLEVKLPGGSGVMLYPKPNHEPATFTVLNFTVTDIEAAVDDLTGRGVKFEQYDMPEIKTDAKGIAPRQQQSGSVGDCLVHRPGRQHHLAHPGVAAAVHRVA